MTFSSSYIEVKIAINLSKRPRFTTSVRQRWFIKSNFDPEHTLNNQECFSVCGVISTVYLHVVSVIGVLAHFAIFRYGESCSQVVRGFGAAQSSG